MTTIRRMAVAMSTAAAGAFIVALAISAEPAAASVCSEECEARLTAGMAACDSLYQPGTDENADCHQGVENNYWSCMYNANTCGQSFYCTVTGWSGYNPYYSCSPY